MGQECRATKNDFLSSPHREPIKSPREGKALKFEEEGVDSRRGEEEISKGGKATAVDHRLTKRGDRSGKFN